MLALLSFMRAALNKPARETIGSARKNLACTNGGKNGLILCVALAEVIRDRVCAGMVIIV